MRTIADLLYPDRAQGRLELERKLRTHPALNSMLLLPGVLSVVTKDIVSYLQMPVGNLAAAAYQRHRRIEEAKRRTADALDSREVIQLMEHTITNKLEPTVEVEFNGARQTVLQLTLATELRIESVTAIVQAGQLADVEPGSATASMRLSAGKVELARLETRPIQLTLPGSPQVVVDITSMGEPIVDQIAVTR